MARTAFAPLRAIVRELIYGPEPVGVATAAVLSLQRRAELGGQMGTPHYGMRGSAETTFAGWIADPQVFQGNAQMGASLHPVVIEQPALPNAEPPAAMPIWIQDWTSMEGLVP